MKFIMNMLHRLIDFSIAKPKQVIRWNVLVASILLVLVLIPTLFPSVPLNGVKIDTDPENMLAKTEQVRVFHNDMRKEFGLYDILVVGIVNHENPQGVFNQKTLSNVLALTDYAKTLDGVVSREIISPSTVDRMQNAGQGVVNFDWLMKDVPSNDQAAKAVYDAAARIPFLNGTLVSEDGQALALYIPIKSKDLSYDVSKALKQKVSDLGMTDSVYITGLPVAQDQFGTEMFVQMAVSAPIAMLLIFLLMFFFFRNLALVSSAMIVAGLSVIVTMGLLVVTGNTVHIMSSMIPIFIMPIAVLDAVHILSDFFERYPEFKDQKKTIKHVMMDLFNPMVFTSVTTVVGFASLALTPIPPVQVFGIFVALGVLFAFLSTITFVPAFVMVLSKKSLEGFGNTHSARENSGTSEGFLEWVGHRSYRRFKSVLLISFILMGVAVYGVSKIQINDNPVKWFSKTHDIRVSDKALNERFAGTYMAYMVLEKKLDRETVTALAVKHHIPSDLINGESKEAVLNQLYDWADEQEMSDMWNDRIDAYAAELQTFKHPENLKAMSDFQDYLLSTGLVGKSNSLADVVKTVHRDLYGKDDAYVIPEKNGAIGQVLLTYQNSHRPNDLWHFVTPDYSKANLWMQLKSGDNADMNKLVAAVDQYLDTHPSFGMDAKWYGMTYINTVWQDKMVNGMAASFIGSFLVVLLLMTLLFRSALWGALAMLPLTITIAGIYGLIGFIGKAYDMPIAVLSSLSLGLAVDYAIHFLARSREMRKNYPSWRETVQPLFGEPARAIFRNVIVVSIGFVPLLFAPLVPYQTVGIFIASILFLAGAVTLVVLPAMMTLLSHWLFKDHHGQLTQATKISIGVIVALIVMQNILM